MAPVPILPTPGVSTAWGTDLNAAIQDYGAIGQFYLVANRITTTGGRTDERTIRIVVVDR